jgi:hypothetical protein
VDELADEQLARSSIEDVDFGALFTGKPPVRRVFWDALDPASTDEGRDTRRRLWKRLLDTSRLDHGFVVAGCDRDAAVWVEEAKRLNEDRGSGRGTGDIAVVHSSAGDCLADRDHDGNVLKLMQRPADTEPQVVGLLLMEANGHEFERLRTLDMEHMAIEFIVFSKMPSMQARMYLFAQACYWPWNGDEVVWEYTDKQWPTMWIVGGRVMEWPEFLTASFLENLSPMVRATDFEPDVAVSWAWGPLAEPPRKLCNRAWCVSTMRSANYRIITSGVDLASARTSQLAGAPFYFSLMPNLRSNLDAFSAFFKDAGEPYLDLLKKVSSLEGFWGSGVYVSLEAHAPFMNRAHTGVYNPIYIVAASQRVHFENFDALNHIVLASKPFEHALRPPGPPIVCLGFISFNRLQLLELTVRSTLEHLKRVEPLMRYETVWVDNGSQNQTELSVIWRKFGFDKPLLLRENRGLPYALNRIYDFCEAPYTPASFRVA